MGADWSFEEDFPKIKQKKTIKLKFYDHTVDFLFFQKIINQLKDYFNLKSSPKNILKKTQHIFKYVQINKDRFIHIKKSALKNNDNVIDIENIFKFKIK